MMKYLKPLTLFVESLKNHSVLFGLSVCDKHVGLAISDHIKFAAYPYGYWPRDENYLDTLVNSIEGFMSKDSEDHRSESDMDGIIVGKNHVVNLDFFNTFLHFGDPLLYPRHLYNFDPEYLAPNEWC
ncbi:hypothetical protein Ddye_029793 [Dipteronia dyeriana]|uniref:Uncharacterized protein n=1 Tax=Dipteronia dyeriana TaxID=168575 RepID=A0AAD9TFV0_9ROSI|nr:hypothetical protein Ddye_029793 [Dipteronia dyeriana]